jgi:uncharacterized FlaG/YvyC family protein
MELDPITRTGMSVALDSVPTTQNDSATNRQIVKAVQQVNQSELLGEDRVLEYRRDSKTGQMVVRTVNRTNGDVVDQIPLEVLLRLQAQIEQDDSTKIAGAPETA